HRRPDQERRDRVHRQHDGRAPGDRRLVLDPSRGAPAPGDLLDHHRRRQGAAAFTGLPRLRPGLVAAGTARGTQREDGMRAPLTTRGAQRLREELEDLKSTKRPAVIAAIAEARAHGDLKENAEYHAA